MLLLTSTSDVLRLVTSSAANSIDVHASYVDISGDTVTPGRGKKDRPARRKRKVVIGDEVYWASDSELPALLQALLTQPEAPPASPREARKRARKRAKAPEDIPVAKIAEVATQRRPEALARLFEAVGEDILLRSLQIAVANLAEQDDEEVLLLTL